MSLQAGVFRTVITPPLGTPLDGGFGLRVSKSVLDDLYAQAVVLDDGNIEMAWLSVDLCRIPARQVSVIKGLIEKTTGIPASNVIIAATHTHSSPSLGARMAGFEQNREDYISHATGQIVSAVRMAQMRKTVAKLGAAKGENRDHIFNRRMKTSEGLIRMNWIDKSFLTDCEVEGPFDPEVTVIKITDMNDHPFAFLVNVANHNNVVGDFQISADYSGYMATLLRKVYGCDVGVLFFPGACGDVNWIRVGDEDRYPPDRYKQIGTSLAGTVLQLDPMIQLSDKVVFAAQTVTINIPERPYCDYDLTDDGTFGAGEDADAFLREYRNAQAQHAGAGTSVHSLELTAMALGPEIAIVTNPCELFSAIGLRIKSQSPFKQTLVSTMTNGYSGYVPTAEAFEEGGYEVRKLPGGSFLATDAEDLLALESIRLLERLHTGYPLPDA